METMKESAVSYRKEPDGYEEWSEHDDSGNLVSLHSKRPDGYEKWIDYDAGGNPAYEKFRLKEGSGKDCFFEQWKDFDANGNVVHCRDSYGLEQWRDYDANGKVVHYKDSEGFENWHRYDDKGNEVYCKDSSGREEWAEYDDSGNEVYYRNSDGVVRRNGRTVVRKADARTLQDATRYGFRDKDFFKKNDAVVVGGCYEVPIFKKNGKFFVAYLVSDCTDDSRRNSCKITRGFATRGEAELAAPKCSAYPLLEFSERLCVYKGYVITRQFDEYVDEKTRKEGLLYSAGMLARRDLSGELGEEFRRSTFVRRTALMKSVDDVKAYIDGIKRSGIGQDSHNVPGETVRHDAGNRGSVSRCDAGGWEY